MVPIDTECDCWRKCNYIASKFLYEWNEKYFRKNHPQSSIYDFINPQMKHFTILRNWNQSSTLIWYKTKWLTRSFIIQWQSHQEYSITTTASVQSIHTLASWEVMPVLSLPSSDTECEVTFRILLAKQQLAFTSSAATTLFIITTPLAK